MNNKRKRKKKNNQGKVDRRCGSSGRVPASQSLPKKIISAFLSKFFFVNSRIDPEIVL
jgi:hypothetical protein